MLNDKKNNNPASMNMNGNLSQMQRKLISIKGENLVITRKDLEITS